MNPLAQMMGGNRLQTVMAQVNQLRQMGNPAAVVQMFARQNPQFAQFVRENQGKPLEDVAKSYGLDWNEIQNLMK